MTATPKFSVLLPTFNRADVLPLAIKSVLAQTEGDFELLIVGDGCTDDTSAVVEPFLKDTRVKWFDLPKAPNFGYANRNKALKQTTSKYVAYMAHDDLWFPDHLERLGEYLDRVPELDLVYSRPLWVDEEGLIFPSPYNIINDQIRDYFFNVRNGIPSPVAIHRRECFDVVGYWDESLSGAGDWDIFKKIIASKKDRNFAFEPSPSVFHFKAIWRDAKNTYPEKLAYLIGYVKAMGDKLPNSLHLPIPENITEQETFFQKMSTDPQWLQQLQLDCLTFFDQLLHLDMPELIKRHDHFQKIASSSQEELARLKNSKFFKLRENLLKMIPEDGIVYRTIAKISRP